MNLRTFLPIVAVAMLLGSGCHRSDSESGSRSRSNAAEEDSQDRRARSGDDSEDDKDSSRSRRRSRRDRDQERDDDSASAGSDDELGIKVCDDYIERVNSCASGPKDSAVFKKMVQRWRDAIADGKRSKVREACEKADKVFKCRA